MKFRLLLVVCLCALCSPLLSECSGPATASGLAAAPTRPTETSSPDPVQVGVLQTELGFSHNWAADGSRQSSLSNLMKLGLWCNTEIRWSINSRASASSSAGSHTGVGDGSFAAQYRFHSESRHAPSLAAAYSLKIPTADSASGLGSGLYDHAFTVMAGKSVFGFTTVANLSYFSIAQPAASSDFKWEWAFAASHAITRNFAFTGEIFGDTRLNPANPAYRSSTWVLSYSPRPRLIFDVGSTARFTQVPSAPGNAVFGGVTYALGNVYYRRPRGQQTALSHAAAPASPPQSSPAPAEPPQH